MINLKSTVTFINVHRQISTMQALFKSVQFD